MGELGLEGRALGMAGIALPLSYICILQHDCLRALFRILAGAVPPTVPAVQASRRLENKGHVLLEGKGVGKK